MHGAPENDDEPAIAGLFNALIHTATDEQLETYIEKSARMRKAVVPMVNQAVAEFNASDEKETRSLMTMYKNGILSKGKYEGVHRCLIRQYSPKHDRTRLLTILPKVQLPQTLSYKSLLAVVRSHNVGELQTPPEVPGSTVRGFRRPLRNLLENLVELFLSNQRMRKSLTWFNGRKNHFVFAAGGDGVPNSRGDPDLTIWSLSILNRGRHVGSPQDNFLLAVAGCKEEHPVMMAYEQELLAEKMRLAPAASGKTESRTRSRVDWSPWT